MDKWFEKYLLPCPFKYFTGIDCPGCGFQRSVIALAKGNLLQSFHFYPATVPILLLALLFLVRMKFRFDQRGTIFRALFAVATITVIVSYAFKIARGNYF